MANLRRILLVGFSSLLLAGVTSAQDFEAKGFKLAPNTSRAKPSPENLAAGKKVYSENCSQCHGDDGDGKGSMADLVTPFPRNFVKALYKIRSTPQGDFPTDKDLFDIIERGMPGTSMPGWKGLLTPEETWLLVDYIKSFNPDMFEYPAEKAFVFKAKIQSSAAALERGQAVYVKAECAKCHGADGRGNGVSARGMKDQFEDPILPADLTQGWTFRGGGSLEDINRILTTGTNGAPMPSFSDAWKASELEDLAIYVHSLSREPVYGEIVQCDRAATLPEDPFDPAWDEVAPMDIRMAPQLIQKPRIFNPSVQTVAVKALFDGTNLALLVLWDDRFENKGQSEEDPETGEPVVKPLDRLAVLFPSETPEGAKKPYFLMGDKKRSVDTWQWNAKGEIQTFVGRGMDDLTPLSSQVSGRGAYKDGQYRVLFRRSLAADGEISFVPGEMMPLAVNVWDGHMGEEGKKRAISRWYYLLLKPETPWTTYLWPVLAMILALGVQVLVLARLKSQWAAEAEGFEFYEPEEAAK